MVFYDSNVDAYYVYKDNTKYYIITEDPTIIGGKSVINLTEIDGYENKINSKIQNIEDNYNNLMKDAKWDLGLTAIRIDLSSILSVLNPFDLVKNGIGVLGSLFTEAFKIDEKIAHSNSYRLQCGFYLLVEQYLIYANDYLEQANAICENAKINNRSLSYSDKRKIDDLLEKSDLCFENAENILNNKHEIEKKFSKYAVGETWNDLTSLGVSSTLDVIPSSTSSDADEVLVNVTKGGISQGVSNSLNPGKIDADTAYYFCTNGLPWNKEINTVKKTFTNSFNRTLNI